MNLHNDEMKRIEKLQKAIMEAMMHEGESNLYENMIAINFVVAGLAIGVYRKYSYSKALKFVDEFFNHGRIIIDKAIDSLKESEEKEENKEIH